MTIGIQRPPTIADLEHRPTSHGSETALFYGYSRTKPAEPETLDCACGGSITAGGGVDVHEAVAAHNASTVHAHWRARGARYG